MIVDVHAHYHPRAYEEALGRLPGRTAGGPFAGGRQPVTDDEAHVETRVLLEWCLNYLEPEAARSDAAPEFS